jgi:hypothetical protein
VIRMLASFMSLFELIVLGEYGPALPAFMGSDGAVTSSVTKKRIIFLRGPAKAFSCVAEGSGQAKRPVLLAEEIEKIAARVLGGIAVTGSRLR